MPGQRTRPTSRLEIFSRAPLSSASTHVRWKDLTARNTTKSLGCQKEVLPRPLWPRLGTAQPKTNTPRKPKFDFRASAFLLTCKPRDFKLANSRRCETQICGAGFGFYN